MTTKMLVPFVVVAVAQPGSYPLCEDPKYGSYWVQPQEEGGYDPSDIGATCVPTAAGNLITYLESKAAGPDAEIAYPWSDVDIEIRLTGGAYVYRLYSLLPFTENGYPYLGGVTRYQKTSQNIQGLYYAMKTNETKGTLIEDGRTGLQQYLDDLNVLGAKTVEGIDRAATVSDFDFLSDYSAPYLLHIEHKCLEQNDYNFVTSNSFGDNIYGNPVVDLKYADGMSTVDDFHGSKLGHTITVYDTDINAGNEVKSMSLYGASGLKASRHQYNTRHCAVTTTNVYSDQECIVGITRIVDPPSSSSKKMSDGEIAAIVVVGVGVIAGAGYYVYRRRQQGDATGYMMAATNFM